MKITISGTPASGKSSIAKLLAEKLGFEHFSMGDFQREIASQKGISIEELGKLEAEDKSIDLMVDKEQEKIGKENDSFVMDSRLAAEFVPDSVKLFVDADENIRAERRLGHKRDTESFDDIEKAKESMNSREEVNRERWVRYYDFDFLDMSNYDYVLDSSDITIEEGVEKIIQFLKTKGLEM